MEQHTDEGQEMAYHYRISHSLVEDFPNLWDVIYDLDEYLAENTGMVVNFSILMIAVRGSEKELLTLLRRYAHEKFIEFGRASFCYTHPEVVLDEENYCMSCDTCWNSVALYKAIKING
jgi:hypothetical protein